MLGVWRLPIGFAQAHVVGRALVAGTQRPVVEQRRRADGVQEARHLLGDARAADVDGGFFRVAVIDRLADARGHAVQRLVPADAAPLAAAARAHPFQRVEQAVGVGVDLGAALALGAQALAVVRVFGVAAHLDQLAVDHVALDAADRAAVQADALDDGGAAVVVLQAAVAIGAALRLALAHQFAAGRGIGLAGHQRDGLAQRQGGQRAQAALEQAAAGCLDRRRLHVDSPVRAGFIHTTRCSRGNWACRAVQVSIS